MHYLLIQMESILLLKVKPKLLTHLMNRIRKLQSWQSMITLVRVNTYVNNHIVTLEM